MITDEEDGQEEENHIRNALARCRIPRMGRQQRKASSGENMKQSWETKKKNTEKSKHPGMVILPHRGGRHSTGPGGDEKTSSSVRQEYAKPTSSYTPRTEYNRRRNVT